MNILLLIHSRPIGTTDWAMSALSDDIKCESFGDVDELLEGLQQDNPDQEYKVFCGHAQSVQQLNIPDGGS